MWLENGMQVIGTRQRVGVSALKWVIRGMKYVGVRSKGEKTRFSLTLLPLMTIDMIQSQMSSHGGEYFM